MSQLTTNTASLQAILETINALPEQTAEAKLQEKSITPTTSSQIVSPDSGYDGLSKVNVAAIPSNYEDVAAETTTYTGLLTDLEEAINALPEAGEGEVTLQEKTVTPSTSAQTITPDTNYDGLSKVTVNAMPTATQATPSISVSTGGLITASSTQSAGYVAAGTKKATKQLTVQAAQTITPGTSNKTIASGRYLTGTQTIKGDTNLKAANIAKGKSIFSVTGTYTSDATATAADIVEGKTAYVNGTKLTGTNPYEKTATGTEVNSQATKLAELKTILAGKAAGGSGGATIDTCSVDLTVNSGSFIVSYTTLDEDGNIIYRVENVSTRYKTITCVCYTVIALTTYMYSISNTAHSLTKAELLD